jgi:MFS family permease
MASQAITTLTSGSILVAFALVLGASNFQIGLIAAIPTLANIFQLGSICLVHKYANRRSVVLICSLLSRACIILIAATPFMSGGSRALYVLIPALCLQHVFGAVSSGCWSSWMRDLIPAQSLGSFFSQRLRLGHIMGVSLNVACALFLDYVTLHWPEYEIWSYATLFFMAIIAGLISLFLLARTPEPAMTPMSAGILQLLATPFRDRDYRNLIIYMGSWNFAIHLATPFFTVYLLKMLQMRMSYVIGFSLLSQLATIVFLRIWGRYSDRYSYKTILGICGPLYVGCILAWTFTTMPGAHALTMPLLVLIYVFTGIATAGTTLASSSMSMKMAPKEDAVAYISATSIVNSLSAGIAPLLGGLFADYFTNKDMSWIIRWNSPFGEMQIQPLSLQQWDFFFTLSFVLGLVALYRLRHVSETGTVKETVVLRELKAEFKQELHKVSHTTGFRTVFFLPVSVISFLSSRKRHA